MHSDPDLIPEQDVFWAPDDLDRVLDADGMMSTFDAQRLRFVDALRLRFLTDAAAGVSQTPPDLVERSLRLELASAMRVTEYAAGALIARARALVHRYPALLDALGEGRVTIRHTELFVTMLDTLPAEVRSALVAPAVELAKAEPVGMFRTKLARLIEDAQKPTLVERHTTAMAQRRVAYEQDADGMAWLHLYGPDVEVKAIHGRLRRMGKAMLKKTKSPDAGLSAGSLAPGVPAAPAPATDERSLDQVTYDIAGDLLIDGALQEHPERVRGIRAEVVVTVPALSLLSDDRATVEPAIVEGVGPIPIAKARELCGGSGEWTRVLTHPETGMILSVGRTKYRPPRSLRRLITWRAGRCLAPGCTMPATACDLDHQIDWADGGHTDEANLGPFCRGHHTVKHGTDWTVEHQRDGTFEWTSPLGRVYHEHPERHTPVFAEDDEPPPF